MVDAKSFEMYKLVCKKVYENSEAVMLKTYNGYMSVRKEIIGGEIVKFGEFHESTFGSFDVCKAAFEGYSPKTMAALNGHIFA